MTSLLGKRLLGFVAALAAVVLAVWGALALAFPPQRVRALVQAQLAGVLAREVKYADASIGLWPPVRLSIEQPTLAEPGGFARGQAFTARSLHLDLDPFSLLSRRVKVRRLVLDRPEIHLLTRADGTTNFDSLMRSTPARPPTQPMDFEVESFEIRDGRVLVDDLKAQRRVILRVGTRVALKGEGGGTRYETSGTTELTELAFGPASAVRLADFNRSLAGLKWTIEHRGKFDAKQQRLAFEKLALDVGRTEIALSGIVDRPGPTAAIDLKARGSGVDLGEVMSWLAAADAKAVQGIKAGGRLDFDLGIRGRLGGTRLPDVVGVLSVANGSFRYPDAPVGVEGLAFTARFAPDSLGIGDLRARVSGQPIAARLAVTRFADPWVVFALQGNVDLAAVAPMVAPKDTKLGGRAALDVRGRGRAKDPGAIVLEGDAKLADVRVASPDLPKPVEKINGSISFSPARATARDLSASAGQSSFTLDAAVTRPLALMAKLGSVEPAGVDFTLRSPYLDLEELLPATPGAPLVPNASGQGRVEIGRLKQGKLDVSAVTARVGLEPGVVALPSFSFQGYGGSSSGSGRFDLRDPARPVYSVKARVDSVDADALLSSWTPVKNLLRGTLNTKISLSGAGVTPAEIAQTLTAEGLAAIARGTLGPGPALEEIAKFVKIPALRQVAIRDGTYPFQVERGKVYLREVRFGGPTGEWRLAGAVGFDGTLDYAVSITLPPELIANLGGGAALAAGALSDPEGRIIMDLRVTGPAKRPKVAWDRRAMQDRVAGRFSQALEEQKKKFEESVLDAAAERRRAAEDSARVAIARARRAIEDSLKRRAGKTLEGFFGGLRDTTRP